MSERNRSEVIDQGKMERAMSNQEHLDILKQGVQAWNQKGVPVYPIAT